MLDTIFMIAGVIFVVLLLALILALKLGAASITIDKSKK